MHPLSAAALSPAPDTVSLSDLPLRQDAWVRTLSLAPALEERDLVLRLVEIGFLPGQRVRVVARASAGGDPIAVRVGESTFALRRGEAALVRVGLAPPANQAASDIQAAA